METKRLILAIGLSMVVMVGYSLLFSPKPVQQPVKQPQLNREAPAQNEPVRDITQDRTENRKEVASDDVVATDNTTSTTKPELEKFDETNVLSKKEELITVESDRFIAVFTNKGAALTSFVLKDYNDDGKPEKKPLDLVSKKKFTSGVELLPFHYPAIESFRNYELFKAANEALYKVTRSDTKNGTEIAFHYKKGSIDIIKRFTLYKNSYVIGLHNVLAKDNRPILAPIVFGPDLGNNLRADSAMIEVKGFDGNDVQDDYFRSLDLGYRTFGKTDGYNFYWGAFDSTYFTALFKLGTRNSRIATYVNEVFNAQGSKTRQNYVLVSDASMVYLGPKEERILAEAADRFQFRDANSVISYGFSWFAPIAKLMLKGINLIYEKFLNFGNYGWAIVIFTIFLKILLFPLTYKSSVSMAKMQTLQPKMKALKKKYKNQKDPEQRRKMNEELMALYRTEKVNPAGGCLPMLLQMPILFAFFMLLRTAINVRHEPWILWIEDLSVLDPYYVLPILMGITQIILQKMSPSSGDAAQKKIMYIMPVVITLIVMNLASGLTLYWFVSNLLQLGQQKYINKKIYQQKKESEKVQKASKRKKGASNK